MSRRRERIKSPFLIAFKNKGADVDEVYIKAEFSRLNRLYGKIFKILKPITTEQKKELDKHLSSEQIESDRVEFVEKWVEKVKQAIKENPEQRDFYVKFFKENPELKAFANLNKPFFKENR